MTQPVSPETYNWLPVLATLASFLLGFVTAVFAEPFKQWLYRPKLKLTFKNDTDHVADTPEVGVNDFQKACYVRVGVENKSRRIARQCRAYLVRIKGDGGIIF